MTDITVAQAAIIEDHVWALMEALGVRDSRKINQRITEAIVTVLDRQRDALPEAQAETKCSGALNVKGEHFPCELTSPHPGWAHSSKGAEAIWTSSEQQVTA